MPKSRLKLSAAFLWTAVVVALIACGVMYHRYRDSLGTSARAEVIALFHQISTGDLIAPILQRMHDGEYPHLDVTSDADGLLIVGTPVEFGATNWLLVVVHDEGHVVGVGVRTQDSLRGRPANAPEDNIAANQNTTWGKHGLQPIDAANGR